TSSNTVVLRDEGISFGGSGAQRTITLAPVPNRFRAATVTVRVGDGRHTTVASFTLDVTPVDDAPTISDVADQTTAVGQPVGPIPFTVFDVEAGLSTLVVTG